MNSDRKNLLDQWNALRDKVHEILLKTWDPIGVGDVSAAVDEYDEYIVIVVRLLRENVSEQALADHLLDIELNRIGTSGDPERAKVAAQLLIKFYRDRFRAEGGRQ